jgi:hypothetical protein
MSVQALISMTLVSVLSWHQQNPAGRAKVRSCRAAPSLHSRDEGLMQEAVCIMRPALKARWDCRMHSQQSSYSADRLQAQILLKRKARQAIHPTSNHIMLQTRLCRVTLP